MHPAHTCNMLTGINFWASPQSPVCGMKLILPLFSAPSQHIGSALTTLMTISTPFQFILNSSLPLTTAFDGQVFLSLHLIFLDVTHCLHHTCLMQAFGSSLLGFFICHQLVFLFSFSLSSRPWSHFCSEGHNYKMQFRLCESPVKYFHHLGFLLKKSQQSR